MRRALVCARARREDARVLRVLRTEAALLQWSVSSLSSVIKPVRSGLVWFGLLSAPISVSVLYGFIFGVGSDEVSGSRDYDKREQIFFLALWLRLRCCQRAHNLLVNRGLNGSISGVNLVPRRKVVCIELVYGLWK